MTFTASQIALLISATIEGDAMVSVHSFGKIEEAKSGQLAFLANPKYEDFLYTTEASVIIINNSLQLKSPVAATLLRVSDAYSAFAILLGKYQEMEAHQLQGIQQPSYVSSTATIGNHVFVGAFAYIGDNVSIGNNVKIYPGAFVGNNVTIGDDTTLHPGVKVYHECKLGKHITIHAGTVIGSDGFGFAPQADGGYKKVPQIGNVVIEDFVEIGANTTIDRATIGSTIIRTGVKLDNLIQIAHNVEVGNNTVIAAQCGISGSTKVGKNVMMGGKVGTAGHISIADGSKIAGQSGITKTIKNINATVTGNPAQPASASLRSQALVKNLPDLEKRIKELEKLVEELVKLGSRESQ